MKNRTENQKQRNSLTSGINIKLVSWVLILGFVVLGIYFASKITLPIASLLGGYILIRNVLKIIRLSIRILFAVVSILCLVAISVAIIVFIL